MLADRLEEVILVTGQNQECRPESPQPMPGDSEPRFVWAKGSAETGNAVTSPRPGFRAPDSGGLDGQALLEALAAGGFLDGKLEDQDAIMAEELDAFDNGRMGAPLPAGRVAAMAVEHMPPGPAQAGWLQAGAALADDLDENELTGMTIAARKLTSWAQATELTFVARTTACAAAADPKIGLEDDGRPVRVCRDALGQISLALTLTGYGTMSWADLAVNLTWRLADTRAAFAAGRIDLDRARAIAEATAVLDDQAARAVEAKVLPSSREDTKPELQRRLRRAVIAADPDGAERRRRAAERHADVRMYADEDQTASLVADKMPQIETAAGLARIVAMARARKAAGLPGSLGEHKAAVLLGLVLGTLPWIPPADGAPPDEPPPDDGGNPGPGASPNDAPGPAAEDAPPGREPPTSPVGHRKPPSPPSQGEPPNQHKAPTSAGPGDDDLRDDDTPAPQDDDTPAPRDEDAPEDDGLDQRQPDDDLLDHDDNPDDLTGPAPQWPELGTIPPALARPQDRPMPGLLEISLPWTVLAGLSDEPGILGRVGPVTAVQSRRLARAAENDPAAQWRVIVTNSAGQAIAVTRIRRRTRDGPRPARDGPRPARDSPADQRPPPGSGLVGRVTVTITQDTLARVTSEADQPPAGPSTSTGPSPRAGPPTRTGPPTAAGAPDSRAAPDSRGASGRIGPAWSRRITGAVLRAAAAGLEQAVAWAAEDAAAGGCAHGIESTAYRPPPRLREFIAARDLTCRFLTCRMPAWRGDLDHTIPWDDGGRTCKCNLGGGCRGHHQLKQHPRWRLEQRAPGQFTWITPGGRRYTVGPDSHLD
jgi:hypothetical protein